ncbi:MAG: hypothetical protein AB8B85_01355 [Paracoccaceae bacterium]
MRAFPACDEDQAGADDPRETNEELADLNCGPVGGAEQERATFLSWMDLPLLATGGRGLVKFCDMVPDKPDGQHVTFLSKGRALVPPVLDNLSIRDERAIGNTHNACLWIFDPLQVNSISKCDFLVNSAP